MTNRINFLDVAKGIGILLVIIGHSFRDNMREEFIILNFIYSFIYSFHMPLFFFIAGYTLHLSKNSDCIIFIKNKFSKLIIPWFSYSIIIYLVFIIVGFNSQISNLLSNSGFELLTFIEYIKVSILGNNPYSFHIWYLLVLFVFMILLIPIKKKKNIISLLLLAAMIFKIIPIKFDFMLISGIKNNLMYFILGFIFYYLESKIKFKLIMVILGITITSVYAYFIPLNLINNNILLFIINFFNSIFGIPLMIFVILQLSKKISKNSVLNYLGMNSFSIYLFHQPFFCGFLGMVLVKILPTNILVYVAIMLICSIASIVGPYLIIKLCSILKLNIFLKKCLGIKV